MDTDCEEPQSSQAVTVPTELLREKVRIFSQRHRELQRAKSNDALRFGLGEITKKVEELDNLTEKDVNGLITRIKRRKHASVEDMYRLNHAFLQSMDHIKLFAKAPGALHVIVKELTGIDSERQIGAVECLCNLSLGEAPVCDKIGNMAGSYLVTYLDSIDERLKRTSLWTIANIISTSQKASETLVQMEIVPKLWRLYVDDSGDKDPTADFREDAAICLQLLVVYNQRVLRAEDLLFINEHMCKKKRSSGAGEYHLQILFHTEWNGMELSMEHTNYLIEFILSNLCNTEDFLNISNRLRILYGIRFLANILACQPHALGVLMQQIRVVWNTSLENILNKIFEFGEKELTVETIYLLRHLVPQQEEVGQQLPCKLENLRIPKFDGYEKLLLDC
ncbi:uncharacterized protein LOC118741132 [Rhagoletis pomonella]|uniref:uncharacterized protein LOC118741132 n=1 Tax=Rhagoletis pomonella TaxID=28610 RepID=UPI00177F4BC9|nr:uncharacterized protein LOC118741132 [Rhagoletis pomonella]